jgi:quinone-modifying oxidoreductase subunit QmoC
MIGRLVKKEQYRKYSHHTDWMFLILLLITSITGILVHIFIALKMPLATYVTFTIHLTIVVPLLAEVPFGKWTHLAYRPFALYFTQLKREAGLP